MPLFIYFIGVAFLASLTTAFRRDTSMYLRWFTPFLLITCIVEIVAAYMQAHTIPNLPLYNLFSILVFSFYFYVLYQVILSRKAKRIVFHISWIYVSLTLINIFFIQRITVFHSMSFSLGCLLIAAICVYYFLELFQMPRSVNLIRQPAFWICSGLLFFYSCSFPVIAFANFLVQLPPVILRSLGFVVYLLNVFLYSSFTIAFLCQLRIRKSTS